MEPEAQDTLAEAAEKAANTPPMATPGAARDYTDNRPLWDWPSKYPPAARGCINVEAAVLTFALLVLIVLAGFAFAFSGTSFRAPLPASTFGPEAALTFDARILTVFICGAVGGTTFSIKWLIHSVAKGSWHLDRRYWRLFVPLMGGVYACAVLNMLDSGMITGHTGDASRGTASAASMSFLIGYFSDGVSGLLTNIANAVFGTLKEK